MILYIPTCSLNMNNILSSDSISPAALYPLRRTGNKRFFSVPACPSDDVIFLYSKIPSYKMSESEMENYRVVIGLDVDKIGQPIKKIYSKHKVDIYVCESTIYFTPMNAFFLYEDTNAYQTCMIQAEQSLENKTFNFYGHKQIDRALEFKWDKSFSDKIVGRDLVSALYEYDRLDRIKGAILCYYAGLNQVKSPELATLKKDARKIKNIFSAIVNSPNKGLSPEQESILEPVIKEFYEVFPAVDPVSMRNKGAIDIYLSSSKTLRENEGSFPRTTILSIIEELGLMQILMQRAGIKDPFNVYSFYDIIGNKRISDLLPGKIAEMDNAIAEVERSLSSASLHRIKIADVFQLTQDNRLAVLDKDAKLDFYSKFMNALIDGEHFESSDQKQNLAIALLGGQILKSLFDEEKWNTSSYRAYTNALLENIQNGSPFDVLSDSHDILQAFAIFSLKGSDIEKLTDNLSQNGISEYRYAWGLFGAAYGYSQLPKTFTNSILGKELLDEIYGLLFPKCPQLCQATVQRSGEAQVKEKAPFLEQEEQVFKVLETMQPDKVVPFYDETKETPKIELDQVEVLKSKLVSVRYGKRAQPLKGRQVEQILEQYKQSGQRLDELFISRIGKIRGIGGESLTAIRDVLGIYPIQAADPLLQFPDDNAEDNDGLHFVTDKGLIGVVRDLRIGDPTVEKIILDDIKFVQEKHIHDYPINNNDCIDHLKNLLFSEKAKKHLRKTANNEQLADSLIDALRIRYR